MESEENLVSPTKFLDVKLLIRLLLILSFLIGCSDTVNSGPASISGGFEETPLVAVEIPDNAVDYTGQAEVVISIEDNVFHDRVITVSAGTNITWVNNGRNRHNVMPSLEEGESGWFLGLNEICLMKLVPLLCDSNKAATFLISVLFTAPPLVVKRVKFL